MFESMTYENILNRCLDRVATDIDKREGSVIFNALAPACAELANMYIALDTWIINSFADTADREYLILRCRERGIEPYPPTKAVLRGVFNMQIPIGSRFNLNELNYTAIAYMAEISGSGNYYYQMECETAGTEGNKYFGDLDPIDFIHKDLKGKIDSLLIPAEDEEDTETLRERYLSSFNSDAFGGNKADYKAKTNKIEGVGNTIVTPVWNGGGTVKLTIVDSEFNAASDALIKKVQELIDPEPQGEGNGLAPIGHLVTVVSAKAVKVQFQFSITLANGYTRDMVGQAIYDTCEAYIDELKREWGNDEGVIIVRVSQIEARVLDIEGIIDVRRTLINGADENFTLAREEIPLYTGCSYND